jgi:PAS domain S-box-containing protein
VDIIADFGQRMRSQDKFRPSGNGPPGQIEHSFDLLCTHDLDGRILTVNEPAARTLGYETDELVRMKIQEILVPEFKGAFSEYLGNIRRAGFAEGLMTVQTRAGEQRVWEYHNTLQSTGVPVPIVWGIAHDITRSWRAEKALREEKIRAQEYLDIAGAVLLVLNADQTVVLINRKGCEILGYKKEEVIGKHWTNNFLPARERDSMNRAFAKLADGQIDPVEYVENPILKKNGEERLIAWHNAVLRDKSGTITATLSSGEDITDRKRAEEALQASEEKFRDLAGSITDIYFAIDQESRITYWNKAAEALSGVAAKDIIGEHGSKLFPEYLGTYADHVLDEALQTRQPRTIIHEYQFRGQKYVFESSANPTNSGISVIARDITDQKRAEEALRASEEQLRLTIDAANLTVWDWDLNKHQITWTVPSRGTLREVHAGSFPCNQEVFLSMVHPEDRKLVEEAVNRSITEGEEYQVEFRMIKSDGTDLWVASYGGVISDATGNATRMIGVARDITERRHAELALRVSETRYRELFENAHDAIATFDLVGRFTSLNRAAETLLGYPRNEALKLTFLQVTPERDHERLRQQMRLINAGETPSLQEADVIGKDGRCHTVEFRARPILLDGRPTGLQVIARDISERMRAEEALRESQQRLETIVKGSNTGLWDWNLKTNEVYYSREWKTQLGYEDHEISNRYEEWESRLHPEDLERTRASVQTFLQSPGPNYEVDYRLRHKNGSYRWILSRGAALFGPDGQPSRMVGSHLDITDRKRAEEKLRQLSASLLRLQDEERRRIARELHDSTAQGMAALAMNLSVVRGARARLAPKVRRSLVESIRLTKQCSKEIRNLSYLLHPPLLDEVGLGSALRWYVYGFQKRSKIRLQLKMPHNLGRLPVEVELVLYRLVQEGLGNIQRHSGSKTGLVDLKLEHGRITLTIADKGRGIPLRDAGILDGKSHAVGVGIQSMRERLRELGGNLWIDSNRRGTTLSADLPYK